MTGGQAGAPGGHHCHGKVERSCVPCVTAFTCVCITPVYTHTLIYTSTGKVYLYNVLDSPASEVYPLGCPKEDEPVRLGKMGSPR